MWFRMSGNATIRPGDHWKIRSKDDLRAADDPPAIRNATAPLAELFSYRLLACRESDRCSVRHADCRQKEGSEADMPRLTVKGRTCRGGFLIDPPGRSQRDACSRRCCASPSHCAIFSSFAA